MLGLYRFQDLGTLIFSTVFAKHTLKKNNNEKKITKHESLKKIRISQCIHRIKNIFNNHIHPSHERKNGIYAHFQCQKYKKKGRVDDFS